MLSRNCRRFLALPLLALIPAAFGAECTRDNVVGTFSQLVYVSPNGCTYRDLPAYIGITDLGNGFLLLEVSDDVAIVGGDTGDAMSCEGEGGFFVGTGCFRKMNSSMRLLTADEIQRVVSVFESLEEESIVDENGDCQPTRCQFEIIAANDRSYTNSVCPGTSVRIQLTQASLASLIELWESFRADFP